MTSVSTSRRFLSAFDGEQDNSVDVRLARDHAGNTGNASYTVKIDKTAPNMVAPNISIDATGPAGAAVLTYPIVVTDNLDPQPSLACTPSAPTGAPGRQFSVGDTQVTCTATDRAGNSASRAFTVHVRSATEQTANLLTLVKGVGPGRSLETKVRKVRDDLAAGTPACADLDKVIDEAAKNPGRALSGSQQQTILSDARRIRAVLGCLP